MDSLTHSLAHFTSLTTKEKGCRVATSFSSASPLGVSPIVGQSPLVGQSPFVGQSPIAVMSPLVNPYDFRRAQNAPVAMTTYVNTPASEIFGGFKGPKTASLHFHFHFSFHSQARG